MYTRVDTGFEILKTNNFFVKEYLSRTMKTREKKKRKLQ